MAANVYDIGDIVRVYGDFTDKDGVATDPTSVFCSYRRLPSGGLHVFQYGVDVEVKKTAVGSYYMDIEVTQEGRHYYRWFSEGTGKTGGEDYFDVEELNTTT